MIVARVTTRSGLPQARPVHAGFGNICPLANQQRHVGTEQRHAASRAVRFSNRFRNMLVDMRRAVVIGERRVGLALTTGCIAALPSMRKG
jgi:hypothetical protein